jgi:hypothetical protein
MLPSIYSHKCCDNFFHPAPPTPLNCEAAPRPQANKLPKAAYAAGDELPKAAYAAGDELPKAAYAEGDELPKAAPAKR